MCNLCPRTFVTLLSGLYRDNGRGGGLFCWNGSPLITKNIIIGNVAEEQGDRWIGFSEGGGILIWGGAALITNNIVAGNSAGERGGGISCGESTTITNNTIFGNSARLQGGGIYGSPSITNTIIRGNIGGEIYGSPTVSYCNVQGGWSGEGNIEAESLFVDPANGDFHLRFGSPCLDMGNNEALGIPDMDFEGDPRIGDGNWDGIAAVDMGADELVPEIAARFGSVNSSSPSIANVLFVNDSFGNNNRVYTISQGNRIIMTLLNSPAASIPADFALYWIWWEPGFGDIALQPEGIGISCMPMPLSNVVNGNPPYPPPLTLANTIGHNWVFGYPMIQALPPAPCTVFDVPQLPSGTYTFQGYIMDNGSACAFAPISLTNAIVLKVQ